MSGSGDNDSFLRQITVALECFPSHRESSLTIESYSKLVSSRLSISFEEAKTICQTIVIFLKLFGVMHRHDDNSFNLSEQIPEYFRHSILWYLQNDQTILGNWSRSGAARNVDPANILDGAAYFLKALEQRRVEVSERQSLESGHSRIQSTTILLIRADIHDEPHFLHQWDVRAEQFQLIGGRKRDKESELDTAKRELSEEIANHQLLYGRDYELTLLNEQPVEYADISRTYGALTLYKLWIYSVSFKIDQIKLSDIDRWISLSEMRNGATGKGRLIANPDRVPLIDSSFVGGFTSVPSSIDVIKVVDYLKYIEFKPGFLGLSLDLKGVLLRMLGRKGG